MKKGVMYVICGAAGLAVIGGVAMYLLLPESVDVAKAVPQDLTEYENAYDKATVNVTYYSDGYNAAVAENNKAQARLNAAQMAAESFYCQSFGKKAEADLH